MKFLGGTEMEYQLEMGEQKHRGSNQTGNDCFPFYLRIAEQFVLTWFSINTDIKKHSATLCFYVCICCHGNYVIFKGLPKIFNSIQIYI